MSLYFRQTHFGLETSDGNSVLHDSDEGPNSDNLKHNSPNNAGDGNHNRGRLMKKRPDSKNITASGSHHAVGKGLRAEKYQDQFRSKSKYLLKIFAMNRKQSVVVENLDFACKENDLRAFFEALLKAERGFPGGLDNHDAGIDDHDELGFACEGKTWVTRLLVVKDRDAQFGKAFAYVQFADRECVQHLLAMERDKLKFATRKLRIQRWKIIRTSRPACSTEGSDEALSFDPLQATSVMESCAEPTPIERTADLSPGKRLKGVKRERKGPKVSNQTSGSSGSGDTHKVTRAVKDSRKVSDKANTVRRFREQALKTSRNDRKNWERLVKESDKF